MPSYSDYVLDGSLARVQEADQFHVCSQEPTTYAQATTTYDGTANKYSVGVKTSPTITAAADRTGGGREVEISVFSDGVINATATATHFALVDSANSRLLLTGNLTESQAATQGNPLSISAAIPLGNGDPA